MTLAFASSDEFLVRPADGEDEINFVRKTWLRIVGSESVPPAVLIYGPHFMAEHHRAIETCLQRAAVSVAYRPSLATRICGFAVTERVWAPTVMREIEQHAIHFVFVRARWRRMGVARLLLGPLAKLHAAYTHKTRELQPERLPEPWTFNPYPFLRTE